MKEQLRVEASQSDHQWFDEKQASLKTQGWVILRVSVTTGKRLVLFAERTV